MRKVKIEYNILKTNDHGVSRLQHKVVRLNNKKEIRDALEETMFYAPSDTLNKAFDKYLNGIGITWEFKGDFKQTSELIDNLQTLFNKFLNKLKDEAKEDFAGLDDQSALLIGILNVLKIEWTAI